MARLTHRVERLENACTVKEIDGAIVYFENEVREKEEDGKGDIVDADYYLNKDGVGELLTSAELEKALDGKMYITFLPLEDKAEDIEFYDIKRVSNE